jgi:hypothetical protein
MQFSGVEFRYKRGGGAIAPQHTAIVTKVVGKKITILHQNWNNVRRVGRFQLDLSEIRKGKVSYYRPQLSD